MRPCLNLHLLVTYSIIITLNCHHHGPRHVPVIKIRVTDHHLNLLSACHLPLLLDLQDQLNAIHVCGVYPNPSGHATLFQCLKRCLNSDCNIDQPEYSTFILFLLTYIWRIIN